MAAAANIANPNPKSGKDEVNILLLGETGMGKSTFINNLLNYLQFDTFEDACRNNKSLRCIIPTKFTVTDNEFNARIVECGWNDNESTIAGESATLKPKSYLFDVPKYNQRFRIIDSPGIGDTRGVDQDDHNQRHIVHYLSGIGYINTVCIFLTPNQTRCTIAFQYCINELLLQLHKTAVPNIIFVFTNTSNSFFTPGETTHSLQKVLKDIEEKQKIIIPFTKENTFCIDNESFRYLLAKRTGINLGNEKIYSGSFSHSRDECWRMINYAMSATPYTLDNALYLYKVREKFEDLGNSLADISDLLKSDSLLLKKFQDVTKNGNSMEVVDANNHIKDIEGRMSKYKYEKDNLTLQISKILIYLRTNSIILFNDFTQTYINYLIDREMSKGIESDRRQIRNYHNRVNYNENIKAVVNMDIHIDPFSPFVTQEELSTVFPELEAEFDFDIDNIADNDIEVLQIANCKQPKKQDDTVKDDHSGAFTFSKLFDVITDSVSSLSDHVEKSFDYEMLRKQYVQEEYTSKNMKPAVNDTVNKKYNFNSDYHKVPFKKYPRNINKSSKETCSTSSNKKTDKGGFKPKNLCFFDQLDANTTQKADNFVWVGGSNDNIVLGVGAQQNNPRGSFRGRGRGRGRGGGRGNKQLNNQKDLGLKPNKQVNTKQNPRNKQSTSQRNKDTDVHIPKNALQSMKNIFD